MHRTLLGLLCLLLVSLPAPLFAHPVAQGAMTIDVRAERVEVRARVSLEEVLVESSFSSREPAGSLQDEIDRHAAYLLSRLHLFSDGSELTGRLVEPGRQSGPQAVEYIFEYVPPVRPAELSIRQEVLNEFEFAPGNRWEATYVVSLRADGQLIGEGLLLLPRAVLDITPRARGVAAALDHGRLFGEYMGYGVWHILEGYDHLLFVSALVLATAGLLDLVLIISAFTLSHTLTLTLSVLDIVRLPPGVVEPMIAASIVFVAAENWIFPERARGKGRIAIAFFFGLFHGLGFAGGLLEAMSGMSSGAVGLAIASFSLGVEIGHQLVVLPLFAALWLLRRRAEQPDRPHRAALRYGSAAISAAGAFYLMNALS